MKSTLSLNKLVNDADHQAMLVNTIGEHTYGHLHHKGHLIPQKHDSSTM